MRSDFVSPYDACSVNQTTEGVREVYASMIVWRRGAYRNKGVPNESKRRQVQSKPRTWLVTGSRAEELLPVGCCGCAESLCRLKERFAKLKKEI